MNYPKYRVPFKKGEKYFYWYNTGLQNQHVLYVQDTLTSEPSVLQLSVDLNLQVFLNPNEIKADGTASVGASKFSKSGAIMAYSLHNSGSDWQEIHFKVVPGTKPKTPGLENSSGELTDVLQWVKFSGIAWDHKELGVFYCRYPAPKSLESTKAEDVSDKRGTETDKVSQQKVYFHRLGTPQSEDLLIYEDASNPSYMFGVEVTDDGKFLIITVSSDCERKNKFYLLDISNVDSYTKGTFFFFF
jgi:prolyl oligopeptidase